MLTTTSTSRAASWAKISENGVDADGGGDGGVESARLGGAVISSHANNAARIAPRRQDKLTMRFSRPTLMTAPPSPATAI
jgi:hypothetical protein